LESHPDSALLDDDEVDPVPSECTSLHPSVSSTTYGSLSSLARGAIPIEMLDDSASRHAADLFAEQQQSMLQREPTDKEREPLLVKTVSTEEGVVQRVIVGQSTLPQTVFNSVNVLIGVGLLSLPLGLMYSGWQAAP
jgi:vesicular inhibitory amino acid transporter